MKFSIQSNRLEIDDDLRAHVERRGSFAFARWSDRITKVDVHLSDENGPRGGVDKRCTVRVHLNNASAAVIEEIDADVRAVLDRALGRAGRLVAKRVERSAEMPRVRPLEMV